jgi:HK97 family phage portal protein
MATRCLGLIVTNAASRRLTVRRLSDGTTVDHPILTIFNKKPNSEQSPDLFWWTVWERLERRGEVYILLDRGPSGIGQLTAVHVLHQVVEPQRTRPTDTDPNGRLTGYRTVIDGRDRYFAPSEILRIHYPDPESPTRALSPLASIVSPLGIGHAARTWQEASFENGAAPSMVVQLPGADAAQVEGARRGLARLVGPRNAGKPAVVGGPIPMEIKQVSLTPSEMSYIESLDASDAQIATGLGTPLDLVSASARRTYENVAAAKTSLWEETLGPKLRLVAAAIDALLVTEPDLLAEFDVTDVEALQEKRDALVARQTKVWQADGCTLDEYRASLGYPAWAEKGVGARRFSELRALSATPTPPPDTTRTVQAGPVETRADAGPVVTGGDLLDSIDGSVEAGVRAIRRVSEILAKDVARNAKRSTRKRAAGDQARAEDFNGLYNGAAWRERVAEALAPWLDVVITKGAAVTATQLGFDLSEGPIGADLTRTVDEYAQAAASYIAETTGAELSAVLTTSVEAGLSVEDTTRALVNVAERLGATRAETIAATEVLGAHNSGARRVVQAQGGAFDREWVATADSRTRDSHAAMDGHRVSGMYELYPNGALHPGDRTLPASERVRCRCVEVFYPTEPTTPTGDES